MTYMVFVEGKQGPTREHATEDEARAEAQRLAQANDGKRVWVLAVVDVLEPVGHHRWRRGVGARPPWEDPGVPDLPKVDPPAPWPTPGGQADPWKIPYTAEVVYYGCQTSSTGPLVTTEDGPWYGEEKK